MLIALSFYIAAATAVVESRVTFATSEVLDNDDLKGSKATATFRCYAGCRVYSPTRNADIVIVDAAGKEWKNLLDLANLKSGDVIELPASTALYSLKNKGGDSPAFVFYAVEKGAMNYERQVAYVNATTQKFNVIPEGDTILTVMSDSGAVRFSNFQGDYTGALPTVHAVPADAISVASAPCLPVYDAYTASTVHNTDFTVLCPIATINLKKVDADKRVKISGDWSLTEAGQDTTAVYVSPGYVGCESVGDSLYTFLPPVTSFDRTYSMSDSNGISLTVDGNWSIEKEADAIQLTVNGDVQKLYGKSQLAKIYDETSFKIAVKWEKRAGSKDRFSLQLDALSHNNGKATTTNIKPDATTSVSGQLNAIVIALMTIAAFAL